MDKAYPLRTSMIVRALEKDFDPFSPKQEGEVVLGAEYPYLSAIGALMYLANNTRPDIAFVVNCLVRHSATPTMRHWNDIKKYLMTFEWHNRSWFILLKKSRFWFNWIYRC
jgi:hypothetical protein